ncbi:PQQ-binding-like beta-propeller repeat protein [Dactylosporangium sp. McL0621]|uniref:outer membrane protein assembly factor BamB family protein n=1 Tax=Dactylosporangium sp. McL0621 TaxID=3415678 RepID=UPI003CF8B16A
MSVIELGDAVPWSPPEPPPRRSLRPVAVLAVALLAATLLAGAGPTWGEPLFSIGDGVLDARLVGGTLLVTRYEPDGPGRFEAHTPTGRLLWTRPRAGDSEYPQLVTAGVAVLTSLYGQAAARDATATALDARTGAQLWLRPGAVVVGAAGPRLVLQDVAGQREPYSREAGRETRLLGVDARTGATVWQQTVPATSLVDYEYSEESEGLVAVDELTAGSVLQRRDPATGAVTDRREFATSGTAVTGFAVRDGRIQVSRVGAPGIEVYDLATGELLWRYEKQSYGLLPCGSGRWCTVGGDGIHAVDAGTGRAAWGIEQYNDVFGRSGDLLMAGGLGTSASVSHEAVVFTIDTRTGAIAHRLDGWIGTYSSHGGRLVVAHTDAGQWFGVVGLYDPHTGGVRVLGRARLGPTPVCVAGAEVLYCTGNGLSVWRLP